LSTQCILPQRIEDDQATARFRIHPYPSILALGILLLELELGVPIESKRSQDNPNGGQRFRNIDADRPVATEMLEECEDEIPIDFIEAVNACLDDQTFTDAFGRDAKFDNLEFRQQIYARIVKPLEDALEKTFNISVEKLDTLSSTLGPISNISSGCQRATPQLSTYTQSGACLTAMAAMDSREKHSERESLLSHQQNHVSLHYDDKTDIGIADQQQ
jgi:hypothetical protein